jgi:hypothetical protein
MIQQQFYELYNELKDNTRYLSFHDPSHPTFKKLMAMGEPIIPLLLNNLWDSWWAIMGLHTLTRGACQIANQDLGKFDLISQAWYDWGKLEGHI